MYKPKELKLYERRSSRDPLDDPLFYLALGILGTNLIPKSQANKLEKSLKGSGDKLDKLSEAKDS